MAVSLRLSVASLLASAFCVFAAAPTGCAYPMGTSGGVVVQTDGGQLDVAFTTEDRALIRDYYRANLPPGLARKGLPPGHRKRLARKGQLPPGIARRALPWDLEQRLSPLPAGHARIIIDTDVLLIDIATDLVVDAVRDIGT